MKRLLVIGLGSIGQQHLAVAKRCYPNADLLALSSSGRDACPPADAHLCRDLDEAIGFNPDFAIIASPASYHLAHATPLLEAKIPLLIEKPLTDSVLAAQEFIATWQDRSPAGVAYLLRFSPLIVRLRELLNSGALGKLRHVQIITGQHLSQWRPGSDYRHSVSARRDLGGGVLLELSHEIDLVHWLLGPVVSLCASVFRSGSLEIETEDTADLLLRLYTGVRVNLHLDMLQHQPRREWSLIGDEGTLHIDLISQQLRWNGEPETDSWGQSYSLSRDALFDHQLTAFVDFIEGRESWAGASLEDALQVLKTVSAIYRAERQGGWVIVNE